MARWRGALQTTGRHDTTRKAAREAKGLSLADIYEQTGIDRSALSKLENVTNENPTIETLFRYAEVVGKRLAIQVLDR